ncbi:MAG: hypothetical protein ACYDCL_07045 [Myxococcales bacterium]
MTAPSFRWRCAACAVGLWAACSSGGATDGGGGSSAGSTGAASSGGSGGGSTGAVFQIPDGGGPPTVAEICQWLWAGQTRFALVYFQQPGLYASSGTGPYCPGPSPTQVAGFTQAADAAAAEVLSLAPPNGGWPDGGGPNVCDDPTSALSVLASQIAQSVAAGGSGWNAPALAACQQGMQASGDLLAFAADGGGSFPDEAEIFGTGDAGGACLTLLQGLVADGKNCLFPFECRPGSYCRSSGADGSCAGICAPLVPAGGNCGPLDQCADGLGCASGLCGGPDAGQSNLGGPDAGCTSNSDCQSCLLCNHFQRCQIGLAGSPCVGDYECAGPLLYCDPSSLTCQPSLTFGQPCPASSSYATCLDGWCDPWALVCRAYSDLGGPCAAAGDCHAGYCSLPDAGDGVCAPLPAPGQPCGPQPLSSSCADRDDYCDIPSGSPSGSCTALPENGQPCASFRCATDCYCVVDITNPGGICTSLPDGGASCAGVGRCLPPYACGSSNVCIVPGPGDAGCGSSADCASANCLNPGDGGLCETPCGQGGFESSLLLSLLLGLGGAVVLRARR